MSFPVSIFIKSSDMKLVIASFTFSDSVFAYKSNKYIYIDLLSNFEKNSEIYLLFLIFDVRSFNTCILVSFVILSFCKKLKKK